MKKSSSIYQLLLILLFVIVITPYVFAQATLEVKSTGKVIMNNTASNTLELRDGTTLKGYIQHDGTNFKFYNHGAGSVILGTNGTNRLYISSAGDVKIGGGAPESKAILDIASSGKGILIPRTTTSAFSGAIPAGLLIYDTVFSKFAYHDGSKWIFIADSTEISDLDGDTKIEVERETDMDTIQFTIGGTEHFSMDPSGHLQVLNTGGSVFVGEEAGIFDDLTSNNNVFLGTKAGRSNTSANRNVALGHSALLSNTTGSENTAIGTDALKFNEGGHNTAVGSSTLLDNVTGEYNVAMGESTLEHGTGHHNVAIGPFSLLDNVTGNYNSTLGADAGKRNTGSGNVFLGYESGKNNYGTGNVFLGHKVGRNMGGDSLLMIDNSNDNTPLIWGDFKTDSLVIHGSLGVNGKVKITDGSEGNGKFLVSDENGVARWDSTIHVSQITGLLGQGYSAIIPDVLYNTFELQLEGVFNGQVVMYNTVGFEIDKTTIPQVNCYIHNPGFTMEFPLVFETDDPSDIIALKSWFDLPYDDPKSCSIVIKDLAGYEQGRWNGYYQIADGYEPGNDGRTRFTMINSQLPDNTVALEYMPDFGNEISYNPETDMRVEIEGITTLCAEVQVDTLERTITMTYDYNEGSGLLDWIRDFVQGYIDRRSMSIGETMYGNSIVIGTRINYYECMPIKYEHIYGFGLHTKLKARIVIAYGCAEPG